MSDTDSSLSSLEDTAPKPTAAKKSKQTEAKPKAGEKRKRKDEEEEEEEEQDTKVQIGNKRFVSLSNFRGKFLVDIREYYDDKTSGELKPGKKGISLSLDQWQALKKKISVIDKMIQDA